MNHASVRSTVLLLCALSVVARADPARPISEWPDYGGSRGGESYTPLDEITPDNVARLEVAWTYHTGDVSDGRGEIAAESAFENTPILVDGSLYLCSPFNRVIALDPETGQERWSYDPGIDLSGRYSNQLVCRGVSTWLDTERVAGEPCRRRIFTATAEAQLIALDAATGVPCADFGKAGQVDLTLGVGRTNWLGEYQVTSPPAVIGGRVVVGAAVSDNQRTDAPSGVVRAFDTRSGALAWSWDPVPAGYTRTAANTQDASWVLGTANVWAPMAVDEARDLLFVPTGNTAPDYYGGHRGRLDDFAAALVALRGSTGELVWHFRTVHHDLWDFDVPAQPVLTTLHRGGKELPAVVQTTKIGHVFVLHRETGEPLFPVELRPVPPSDVPGERASPTQPFPVLPPRLTSATLTPEDAWGLSFWDRGACADRIKSLRFDGIFTPPSLQGSIMYPGNAGGSNWGGMSIDPVRQLAVTRVSDVPWVVTLFPSADYASERAENPGVEIGPQRGTPYAMRREILMSPLGLPCNPPPWGSLVAIDLATGKIRWRVPHGGVRDLIGLPIPWEPGVPGIGGPLTTKSGLVFIAAAMDDYLRAFDSETGAELWRARLPAGGQATPMSYRARPGGRQFVVIAAGGHARAGTRLGDALVAYALP